MNALATPPTTSAPAPAVPGVAVGCDVVAVHRLAQLLARRPAARERLFTAHELAASTRDGVAADDPVAVRRLAARFAAKEALVKLLGRPELAWTDVEVHTDAAGAPAIRIHGRTTDIAVSLSHDGDTAMAVVARAAATASDRQHDPTTSHDHATPHDPARS